MLHRKLETMEVYKSSPQPESIRVIAIEEQVYHQQPSYTGNLEMESVMIKEEVDDGQFSSDEVNDTQFINEEDAKDDDQKKEFGCDLCTKMFLTKYELERHIMWHPKLPNEKQYKCEICSKIFNDKSNLNKHVNTHTETKDYECEECHKKFLTSNNLTLHKVMHTEERPFKCDCCVAAFKSKVHLNRHKYSHAGEKLHKCNLCSKKYKTKNALSVHFRIHTETINYVCELCDRIFTQKSSITFHNRICTKENPCPKVQPLTCDLCQNKFWNVYDLSSHKKLVHTKDTPYKCCECPKSFKTRFVAKRHIINMHKHIDINTVIIDKLKTHFVEPPALETIKVEPE